MTVRLAGFTVNSYTFILRSDMTIATVLFICASLCFMMAIASMMITFFADIRGIELAPGAAGFSVILLAVGMLTMVAGIMACL